MADISIRPNQNLKTFKLRGHSLEETLKLEHIRNPESFSKHLSDLSQILNLTLGDQTENKRCKKYHQWKKTSKIYN